MFFPIIKIYSIFIQNKINLFIFQYKLAYTGEYVDENEQGTIYWNDPRFNIDWPTNNPILSKRDKND